MSGQHKPSGNPLAQLYSALAKAQGEFEPITKSTTGYNNGQYFYYADLNALISATRPALTKYGLTVIQPVRTAANGDEVATLLIHESGAQIESALAVKVSSAQIHEFGAQVTLLRRFAYQGLLCLAGEEPQTTYPMTTGAPDQQAANDPVMEPEAADPVLPPAVDLPPADLKRQGSDDFLKANLPRWAREIKGGKRTAEQVIERASRSYLLTEEVMQQLRAIAVEQE